MLVFQSFESPQCLTAAVFEAVAARAYGYFNRWRFARRWRRGCRGVPPRVCRWWPGLDRVLLLERRYGCNNEAENGFWSCSHFEHAGGVELALFEAERSALPRRVCPAYPATNVCVIAPKSPKVAAEKPVLSGFWSRTTEPCSCLSIVQFATGPKRSMGHILGAEKINFLMSRY